MCPIPSDEIEAVKQSAVAGDVDAMLRMIRYFHLYLYSASQAVPWARMAANAGSMEGKFWLAVMLFYNDADHSNDQEAITLMREAAAIDYKNSRSLLDEMKKENEANNSVQEIPAKAAAPDL